MAAARWKQRRRWVPVLGRSCPFQGLFRCFGPWLPPRFPPLSQPGCHPPAQRARRSAKPFLRFLRGSGHQAAGHASRWIPDDPTVLLTIAGMLCRSSRCSWGSLRGRRRGPPQPRKCIRTTTSRTWAARRASHNFSKIARQNFSFGDYFQARRLAAGIAELFPPSCSASDSPARLVGYVSRSARPERSGVTRWGLPPSGSCASRSPTNYLGVGVLLVPAVLLSELYYDFKTRTGRMTASTWRDDSRFIEFYNSCFMEIQPRCAGVLTPLGQPQHRNGPGTRAHGPDPAAKCRKQLTKTDLNLPADRTAGCLAGLTYPGLNTKAQTSLKVIGRPQPTITQPDRDGGECLEPGGAYILRRCCAGSLRHGRLIGIDSAFLHAMGEAGDQLMAPAYPELLERGGRSPRGWSGREARFLENPRAGGREAAG